MSLISNVSLQINKENTNTIIGKWIMNMNKYFQKKKYKYSLANKHMRKCLTSPENKK